MVQSCIICREEGSKGFFGLKGKSRAIISAWVKSARLDNYFLNNPSYFLNNPSVKICFRHFRQDCFKFGKERLMLKPGMFLFLCVSIVFYELLNLIRTAWSLLTYVVDKFWNLECHFFALTPKGQTLAAKWTAIFSKVEDCVNVKHTPVISF